LETPTAKSDFSLQTGSLLTPRHNMPGELCQVKRTTKNSRLTALYGCSRSQTDGKLEKTGCKAAYAASIYSLRSSSSAAGMSV
jgi:hypothetical protein